MSAVCLLDAPHDADWMQAVAAEIKPLRLGLFASAATGRFELPWFTPAIEVDLCGHALKASAHVLWTEGLVRDDEPIRFLTRSGVLKLLVRGVSSSESEDFSHPAHHRGRDRLPGCLEALGVRPTFVGKSTFDKFLVVESEEVVRSLEPDFRALGGVTRGCVV